MTTRAWIWSGLAVGFLTPVALAAIATASIWTAGAESAPAVRPRAVVPVEEYNFGVMDPSSSGSYSFVVRNTGRGALRLDRGPTTCKCTLSSLSQNEIPPGGQALVRLDWNTGHRDLRYEHSATVLTNDPVHQQIQFRVHGRVRTRLAASPEPLVFADVAPGQSPTGRTVLYSQLWQGLRIVELSSSLNGLEWEVEPLDEAQLSALDARGGCVLQLKLPADLPAGHFSHWIRLLVESADQVGPAEPYELTLSGNRLGSLAVMGAGIDSSGTVDLGVLRPGQGAERQLLLKVRDSEPELTDVQIRTTPDFVQARLQAHPGMPAGAGLYQLHLLIPRDAPSCSYLRGKLGQLHIDTHHERVGDMTLKLRFAILKHHE